MILRGVVLRGRRGRGGGEWCCGSPGLFLVGSFDTYIYNTSFDQKIPAQSPSSTLILPLRPSHPHPRDKTPPLRAHSQQYQRPQHNRRRNSPKEKLILVINRRHRIKVHTKVARQKRQRQEETRNERQLSHALVLVGRDAVEDERGQVLGGTDAHVGAV